MTQGNNLFVLRLKTTWKGKNLLDVKDEIQTIIGYFYLLHKLLQHHYCFFPIMFIPWGDHFHFNTNGVQKNIRCNLLLKK